ncbi:MAG: ABC transporter ATP-binding protein [Deltaproteobacteria bacterium]|nr:ABC transporter ATP-binding protein [Deltaproteobacteria bacterium]
MIKAENLSRSFGSFRALNSVSFEIKRGWRTALLGPNGAGKSTLMKIVAGALSPDGGSITAQGKDPKERRTVPGFLGWLPERAPLIAELTVEEHLTLAARFRGLTHAEAAREKERLSESLNLEDKLKRPAGRLSLGSRRQAALALALIGSPALVILDEPGASLDPEEAERLKTLVASLPPDTTLLISSHNLPEAAALTGGVLVIAGGELKAAGSWMELGEGLKGEASGDEASLTKEIYFKALGKP